MYCVFCYVKASNVGSRVPTLLAPLNALLLYHILAATCRQWCQIVNRLKVGSTRICRQLLKSLLTKCVLKRLELADNATDTVINNAGTYQSPSLNPLITRHNLHPRCPYPRCPVCAKWYLRS